MQFAQPLWLIAGFAACALLLWQYRRFDRAQRDALAQFAAVRLHDKLISSVSATRRRVKRSLFTLGILLLFVALARPQSGFVWQETHRKGLELLFAVDTSKSMLAQDIKPDRLTRAKLGVHDLVTQLNGDGVGLIAFAGSAFLQCPVTLDYDAFRQSLSALDTSVIPHGGTNIAAAIREAEAVFKARSTGEKILVLVTDGEDLDGEGITAAERVAKDGVKIFTVGVGGSDGELVPVPDENGGIDFAKDADGQLIKSHLDEATLKKIAEATGGMYQPLGAQAEGLAKIYDEGLANFTREDLSSRQAKVPLERFYWPLLGALLCLLGEMLIGNRRRSMKAATPAPAGVKLAPRPALRHAALALLCIGSIASTQAASPQSAEQAYKKGDFAKAKQEYADTAAQQPGNAPLHFNAGSAAYKAGDYAQATTGFQQSLNTDQVALQHDAYYNLGNTQYRVGQQTAKDKPQETIKTWEEAVKSYDAALQIAANDTEAKHNRDFVQRKLAELKQQEEQKKQDQQKQDPQKQDQKDQSNDQQQKQDQQNESKEQQKDSKDSKGGSQGQKQDNKDSKDNQGDAKEQQAGEQSNPDPGQKNEAKADKQQKPGDSKEQQAGAKPDESKQDPQADAKSGQGKQPKPVNAEKKTEQGKIEAASGDKPSDALAAAAAAEEERREPGQMTKAEARQLLDALKGDERQVPMISAQGRAAAQPNEHKILKDW
jgi:Ca-activated chloride channel homolog